MKKCIAKKIAQNILPSSLCFVMCTTALAEEENVQSPIPPTTTTDALQAAKAALKAAEEAVKIAEEALRNSKSNNLASTKDENSVTTTEATSLPLPTTLSVPISTQAKGEEESSLLSLSKFCSTYHPGEKFYLSMKTVVLEDAKLRGAFVKQLQSQNSRDKVMVSGCQKSLTEALRRVSKKDTSALPHEREKICIENRVAVSTALLGGIPGGLEIVQKDAEGGGSSCTEEWVDILSYPNEKVAFDVLFRLVSRIAQDLRNRNHAEKTDGAHYGKELLPNNGKSVFPPPLRIGAPELIQRYFSALAVRDNLPKSQDFDNLNIIFAATTPAYREILAPTLASVVARDPKGWIASFRHEPLPVEMRLIPLMEKASGGEIVSELLQLSEAHWDPHMRALCLGAFEYLAYGKQTQEKKSITEIAIAPTETDLPSE